MPGMDHLIFVATRMQIRMEAYPKWCAHGAALHGGAWGGMAVRGLRSLLRAQGRSGARPLQTPNLTLPQPHPTQPHPIPPRGDLVRLETYFAEDGRLTTRRDWHITDAATGAHLGAATRCAPSGGPQGARRRRRAAGARGFGAGPRAGRALGLQCAPGPHPPSCARTQPPSLPHPSTWVTINSETRKLAKLPEDVRARWLPLSPSPPRAALPPGETRRKLEDFPEAPALQGPLVTARRSDVDPNGHINNVCYLSWALEAVPADTYGRYDLEEVRGCGGRACDLAAVRKMAGLGAKGGGRGRRRRARPSAGALAARARARRPAPVRCMGVS
jgi:hypothetical protein